jgi:toxin HigB-1
MEIIFEKEYLQELYTEGKAGKKKYRFPKQVIKQYKKAVERLELAQNIEELYQINSLNYEKLTNSKHKKDIESVRVNNQYRIEFRSRTEGEDPNIITICSLIELSNHYD